MVYLQLKSVKLEKVEGDTVDYQVQMLNADGDWLCGRTDALTIETDSNRLMSRPESENNPMHDMFPGVVHVSVVPLVNTDRLCGRTDAFDPLKPIQI